ncbi:TPA: hypothetical protein N3A33_004767 [Salmonella enterica subsp. salamae serovar 28:r:e,n,z15]|nr:hypothetical protein [Salmonella enterica subsp. salamae serovar 28:r:e,n,z15]
MSIPVQTPFNLFIANGSTTVFPFHFLLMQASDLRITANGKAVSSGFSVSGQGDQSGGQVTFSSPPARGTKIAIMRNIPLRRDTEYQDNGDLLASTINADFDRLWMAVQGVDAEAGLALSRTGQDVDYYDAKGFPVTNLKDPVNPQDAVTKKVMDSAVSSMEQQVQDAKTHLDSVQQDVLQSEKNTASYALSAINAAKTSASDTASLLKIEIKDDLLSSKTYSEKSASSAQSAALSESGAQQALKEAKEIAKTPGPKGDPGPEGPPGPKGDPGTGGSADLNGVKTTVPIPATGFNSATQYPLYAHEAISALPDHPIPGSSGNAAWGVLWVNTRGGYPGQIFMNYDGRMFCRIRANYGWSAWWQMAGTPVSGGVGTERRLSCSQAVTYGKNVAGSTLTPAQPGTWFAKGDATAGENIMYMRVK